MFDKEPNIDIVFRNGLKDFEVLPPAELWDSIPAVKTVRSWRRIIYPVAATLAIMVTLGAALDFLFGKPENNTTLMSESATPAVDQQRLTADNNMSSEARVVRMSPGAREVYDEPAREGIIAGDANPSVVSLAARTHDEGIKRQKVQSLASASVYRQGASGVMPVVSYAAEKRELVSAIRQKNNSTSLMIGGAFNPSYSVVSAGGDAKVSDLMTNEDPSASYSGGVTLALNLNRRFTIQTGLNLTSMGQNISGVEVYAGLSQYYSAKGQYTYIIETATGNVVADNADLYINDLQATRVGSYISEDFFDPSKQKLDYVNDEIRQRFKYIEVPIIARYKIIDRKIDLNFSGGLAYGILVENSAFAVVDQKSVKIGHTEGINDFSLSSQLGLGLGYDISKNVSVNIEPVFRYYITPVSELSDAALRPYSYGLYSGFFFRF